MQELAQLITNGLVYGSILALGAIGITLPFGLLKIANFAHGDLMTAGAYAALVANTAWHLPLIASALLSIVAIAALSVALEFVLWRPLRRTGAGFVRLLLAAFGLALGLRSLLNLFAGPKPRQFDADVFQAYSWHGITVSKSQLSAVVAAAVVISLVAWIIGRTMLGKQLRAMSQNRSLAAVSGVQVDHLTLYAWVMTGTLVALAGVLQGLVQSSFTPDMGWNLVLALFAAAVVGGVGNAYGALLGGLALGLLTEVSTWSALGGGLPFSYKPAVAFLVIIVVLLIRPSGLLGRASLR